MDMTSGLFNEDRKLSHWIMSPITNPIYKFPTDSEYKGHISLSYQIGSLKKYLGQIHIASLPESIDFLSIGTWTNGPIESAFSDEKTVHIKPAVYGIRTSKTDQWRKAGSTPRVRTYWYLYKDQMLIEPKLLDRMGCIYHGSIVTRDKNGRFQNFNVWGPNKLLLDNLHNPIVKNHFKDIKLSEVDGILHQLMS